MVFISNDVNIIFGCESSIEFDNIVRDGTWHAKKKRKVQSYLGMAFKLKKKILFYIINRWRQQAFYRSRMDFYRSRNGERLIVAKASNAYKHCKSRLRTV